MPHQLGRYTRMLLAALEEHAAVGVRNVLERDLGRPATRSELSAVRRAANHLSATGRAGVVHVQAPRLGTGPGSSYLALIRLGAEDVSAEQLAAAVSPVVLPPLRDDLATTARLVSIVARAAEVAPRIRDRK